MKENIPRLSRTDNPDWDCLLFRGEDGRLDFRLFPAAEHVLYDETRVRAIDVLPWPSSLNLEKVAMGYRRVSHKIADAVRGLLNPKPQLFSREESEYSKQYTPYL